MLRWRSLIAGILFAIIASSSLSCSNSQTNQPTLNTELTSVPAYEHFLTSAQRESRELLVDGRVTPIEWNISGNPSIILMRGETARGGDFFVSMKSLWTTNTFLRNEPDGFYLLLQWPDLAPDYLEHPLVTSADVFDDNGNQLIDCSTGDSTLVAESSWTTSTDEEDQVIITLYSDGNGSYPADVWRWGAGTTDPVTPVNGTEFIGAQTDGDTLGQTTHPGAGFMEDMYDVGAGPVRDVGKWTYMNTNHQPGSSVPLYIVSRGTRDTRFNRGKPIPYSIWDQVAARFGPCDLINPIRVDDASKQDKTWNPGDYVPSVRLSFPDSSQKDVLAKGTWAAGKWGLEIRRDLISRPPDVAGVHQPPRPDDVPLVPGQHYAIRITIIDGRTHGQSHSDLIPVYLKPN
jgi:hypothetical protein